MPERSGSRKEKRMAHALDADTGIQALTGFEIDEVNGGTVRDYLEGIAVGIAIGLLFL